MSLEMNHERRLRLRKTCKFLVTIYSPFLETSRPRYIILAADENEAIRKARARWNREPGHWRGGRLEYDVERIHSVRKVGD